MMESAVPPCNTCGEPIGFRENGEVFVACYECNFPVCQDCYNYELNEGGKCCLRCSAPYVRASENSLAKVEEVPCKSSTMATHLSDNQGNAGHVRNLSNISAAETECTIGESGNPIWKNRLESWKEEKNKKAASNGGKEAAEIPTEQQMEEKQCKNQKLRVTSLSLQLLRASILH